MKQSSGKDAYEKEEQQRTTLIKLAGNSKMKVRNAPALVRAPYIAFFNGLENYCYSLLLQYMPYRLEIELLEEYYTRREASLAREDCLKGMSEQMNRFRERNRQLENVMIQSHSFEIL